MAAADGVVDIAGLTTVFMTAPPSEADGRRMRHAALEDFQTASNLLWVPVQRCPQTPQERFAIRCRAVRKPILRSRLAIQIHRLGTHFVVVDVPWMPGP